MDGTAVHTAANQYDEEISVCYQKTIVFGYFLRAIDVEIIFLQTEFYDASNNLLEVCKKDIAREVCADFHDISGIFPIHAGQYVKLSLQCKGKCIAVSLGGPFAYFC